MTGISEDLSNIDVNRLRRYRGFAKLQQADIQVIRGSSKLQRYFPRLEPVLFFLILPRGLLSLHWRVAMLQGAIF